MRALEANTTNSKMRYVRWNRTLETLDLLLGYAADTVLIDMRRGFGYAAGHPETGGRLS
jgi:hypothetical protein